MLDVPYAMTRTLPGVSFGQARERITVALQKEGFGVLTEIDVRATMKKKLDVEFRPYVILGACNPQLAHQALTHEPALGLLLPCNVVVAEDDDGAAVVSILKPQAMFGVAATGGMERLAEEASARLARALASL